jgi:hypothetical protein
MARTEHGMAFAAINAATELDVLWITACLGCDGDTIAMTAATQAGRASRRACPIPAVMNLRL